MHPPRESDTARESQSLVNLKSLSVLLLERLQRLFKYIAVDFNPAIPEKHERRLLL